MPESEKFEAAEAHLAAVAILLDEIQDAAESPIRTALDLDQAASRLRALLSQAIKHVEAAALA